MDRLYMILQALRSVLTAFGAWLLTATGRRFVVSIVVAVVEKLTRKKKRSGD